MSVSCPRSLLCELVLSLLFFSYAEVAMAEQAGLSLEDQKKIIDEETKKVEAETLLNNAKKALVDSQKNLATALVAPSASKIQSEAEATRLKSELDITKAKSDRAAAENELFKNKLGTVPDSPFSGTVTLNENSGSAEAALLAAAALKKVANQIYLRIMTVYDSRLNDKIPVKIIIMSNSEVPSFGAAQAFRIQKAVLAKAYIQMVDEAKEAYEKAPMPPGVEAAAPQMIGLAVDAANKLLNFFRTDYTVKSIDINAEDLMLINALAGEISNRLDTRYQVILPATFNGEALANAAPSAMNDFFELQNKLSYSLVQSQRHKRAADFYAAASKSSSLSEKEKELDVARAAVHTGAAEKWKSVAAMIDAFLAKLTTPDEKGTVPLAWLLRENSIADALGKDSDFLVVKLHSAKGALYTKKNILTSLGSMPFYVMGSAVASFSLFDGKNGKVLVSDLIPAHGGYTSVSDVEAVIDANTLKEVKSGSDKIATNH